MRLGLVQIADSAVPVLRGVAPTLGGRGGITGPARRDSEKRRRKGHNKPGLS